MVTICLLVIGILLIVPYTIIGDDGLTLIQAFKIVEDRNLSLQQQKLLVQQAEAEISIQQTGYYPSLSVSGLSTWAFFNKPPVNMPGETDRVSISILSLGIDQPIFRGFRTENSINMAESRFDSQKMYSQTVQNRLLLQTGLLYYDLQLNLLSQDVLHQSLSRARNQLEKTRNLLDADQVAWFDTLEVANRMLEIATSLNELEGYFAILKDKLAHLLNVSELPEITLQPTNPPAVQTEDLKYLKQLALLNRAELKHIKAKRDMQGYQIEMNKASYYPVISASGGFNYGHMDGFFFTGEWVDFYNVMINFQWDLWNWKRDKNKVQQSRLEYQRLDLEEQQLLLDINNEIKEAYEQHKIILRQIEMQNRLYAQEKDRYEITHERFQQGLTTALDLSSAEHALTSAQLQLQKSYVDWYKNNLQMQYATGQIGNLTQEVDK